MATEEVRGSFAIPGAKPDDSTADSGDYIPKNIFLTGGAGKDHLRRFVGGPL